jgi:hypothetical protein
MKQRIVLFFLLLTIFVEVNGYRRQHTNRRRHRRHAKISHRHYGTRRLVTEHHRESRHSRRLGRKSIKHRVRRSAHTAFKRHLKKTQESNKKSVNHTQKRKLTHKLSNKSEENDERKLNYPNLPNQGEYINPLKKPLDKIDTYEQEVLNNFLGPKFGGIYANADMFLRDANYTRTVRDMYRSGRLYSIPKDFSRIDENYFEGSVRYIEDRYIPDDVAISEMNFEQYKHHLLVTMTADREDQEYMNKYFKIQNAQNRMLNFRDTRDIVFESILRMEEVIYGEQQAIINDLETKAAKFESEESEKVFKMMADTLGKPFYLSTKSKDDIFA